MNGKERAIICGPFLLHEFSAALKDVHYFSPNLVRQGPAPFKALAASFDDRINQIFDAISHSRLEPFGFVPCLFAKPVKIAPGSFAALRSEQQSQQSARDRATQQQH